jgi:hypothetical protein
MPTIARPLHRLLIALGATSEDQSIQRTTLLRVIPEVFGTDVTPASVIAACLQLRREGLLHFDSRRVWVIS